MDLKKLFNTFEGNLEEMELNLSADCVIFTIQENTLKVLLTKLESGADWMLPGGFINKSESADSAADRILLQRTGLENIFLQQFQIFSNPYRFSFKSLLTELGMEDDERIDFSSLPDRVISIGYFALVNFQALKLTGGMFEEDTIWADVYELPALKFDHADIISGAHYALKNELYLKPIAYNFLPERFTMPELQKLYEIILDRSLERSSFQKKMLKWDIYERLEERREGVAHKRPFLYRFDPEKYEEACRLGIRFGI